MSTLRRWGRYGTEAWLQALGSGCQFRVDWMVLSPVSAWVVTRRQAVHAGSHRGWRTRICAPQTCLTNVSINDVLLDADDDKQFRQFCSRKATVLLNEGPSLELVVHYAINGGEMFHRAQSESAPRFQLLRAVSGLFYLYLFHVLPTIRASCRPRTATSICDLGSQAHALSNRILRPHQPKPNSAPSRRR